MNEPRIIVALDYNCESHALKLAKTLNPKLCRLKIGKQLFTATGPQLVEKLMHLGFDIFLDLKFHDIPNTVAGACKSAANMGIWMINVHALGGRKMLLAAREALPIGSSTKLIAVTVLTSMEENDLQEIGLQEKPDQLVKRLAHLTRDCELDGIVCSALETQLIRQSVGNDFILVTPGIRLSDGNADDQQRITTPIQAIKNGADYLVIGRPITAAIDPLAQLEIINREINLNEI